MIIKKIKATKSNGSDNEQEEEYEKECVKYKTLQENSALTEVMYEMLVSELKKDPLSLTVKTNEEDYERYEKEHLAIDNMGKIIDERCYIESVKSGYVGGCIKDKNIAEIMTEKLKSKDEEVKQM